MLSKQPADEWVGPIAMPARHGIRGYCHVSGKTPYLAALEVDSLPLSLGGFVIARLFFIYFTLNESRHYLTI